MLSDKNIPFTIIEYLKNPLKVKQLKHIIKLLDLNAFDIVRTTEKDYKDNNLEALSNDEQKLLEAIEQFPKIMQRPIIIHGKKAVIGRPPENINKIL
ncbi:MAG: arsenate reductase (glutaredoxin) [Candidatus Marinimicrobia bacterium]|nr:arsenate reductase (glutaredoxin) [Candidatus Neomarinimicrobiota bacterium]